MTEHPSTDGRPGAEHAPIVRLTAVDEQILDLLRADGRMPNSAVAQAVGIAPSTCLARVRALRERGVIRGFHADVDPAATGRTIQALIAVRLHADARGRMTAFVDRVCALPEVLDVYFLGGEDDYLLHVAAGSASALRDLVVDHLSAHAEVSHTNTSLIFDHIRPRRP